MATIGPETQRLAKELVALRREFHARPELGFQEVWSASRIAGSCPVSKPQSTTGPETVRILPVFIVSASPLRFAAARLRLR